MTSTSVVSAYETHLSRLFFTPDRVYKLLKPVSLPFVDFSDTTRRCAAATQEFERNHAISPDVYLGLADVQEKGELVDRMIVMRRLQADQELRWILRHDPDPQVIRLVARHIATIHAGLDSLHGADADPASARAISKNWEDNFAAIEPLVGEVIEPDAFDEVQALARTYVAGRTELFQSRIDSGWVRDGHGDLRAEHIYCTDDGPRVIDCVAFDDRLRISDSLADIAFLAMDLERISGPAAAVTFMQAWNEFTNEHHPASLAHFYVAYRAHIRCKIACLRHSAGAKGAAATAQAYHRLALRHLRLSQVQVVLVGGGPGSGKSTIAEATARHLGAAWLRADEVRKDMAGVGHDVHHFEEPGQGIYSPEATARTHAELLRQTRMLLARGRSVVIDATWRSAERRQAMRELADASSAHLGELRCDLPVSVAKERIARRLASIYNPSDATPELVDVLANQFDPWPESTTIDTGGSIAESVQAACRAITAGTHQEATPSTARFVVDIALLRDSLLINHGLS